MAATSWRRWTGKAAVPALVMAALALLDLHVHDEAPAAGVLLGMGLMGALMAVGSMWQRHRDDAAASPLGLSLVAGLRAVLDGALGVLLVFVLSAPLALLLPEAWTQHLMQDEHATDLMVLLLLGVGLLVAARALWRASRQEARAALADRDAAMARAALAEQERALARTELGLLRAQVEPHFLWNTLAHLEYLMRHDVPRAQALLQGLVHYLRTAARTRSDALAPLAQEFASVHAYLQLMQLRMGERLQVDLALAPECATHPFPALVLHTLVENAIKHGLEPSPRLGLLQVRAWAEDQRLVIEVVDNGVGLQPQPATAGSGLGLRNVRERLRAHFGDAATLQITGQPQGGVTVRLTCPGETAPAT